MSVQYIKIWMVKKINITNTFPETVAKQWPNRTSALQRPCIDAFYNIMTL